MCYCVSFQEPKAEDRIQDIAALLFTWWIEEVAYLEVNLGFDSLTAIRDSDSLVSAIASLYSWTKLGFLLRSLEAWDELCARSVGIAAGNAFLAIWNIVDGDVEGTGNCLLLRHGFVNDVSKRHGGAGLRWHIF